MGVFKRTALVYKKIFIDGDTYIRYNNKDDYELHIRACGPTGAWVYKFERGSLKWRQRRSYAFVAKPSKPHWDDL